MCATVVIYSSCVAWLSDSSSPPCIPVAHTAAATELPFLRLPPQQHTFGQDLPPERAVQASSHSAIRAASFSLFSGLDPHSPGTLALVSMPPGHRWGLLICSVAPEFVAALHRAVLSLTTVGTWTQGAIFSCQVCGVLDWKGLSCDWD